MRTQYVLDKIMYVILAVCTLGTAVFLRVLISEAIREVKKDDNSD